MGLVGKLWFWKCIFRLNRGGRIQFGCLPVSFLLCISMFLICGVTRLAGQSHDEAYFNHLRVQDGLPGNRVYYIQQDYEGFIWFATESGLCRFDGYRFENFTVEDGISKNEVRRLYEDQQHNLWILTQFGLAVKREDTFFIVDTFPRILEKRVLSILQDSASNLWLTTLGDVHRIRRDGQIAHINQRQMGSPRVSPALEFVTQSGEVWLSAGDHFVVMRDTVIDRTVSLTYPIQGSGISFSAATYLSNQNVLYSSSEGLALLDGDAQSSLAIPKSGMPAGFEPQSITAMLEDVNDLVWVASEHNGLMRIRMDGRTLVKEAHMLEGVGVNHLFLDREGNLWVATNDGVYMRSRNATVVRQVEAKKLMADPIVGIKPDRKGHLWLLSNTGRLRINIDGENTSEIDLGSVLEPGEVIANFEILLDESLLVGTNRGLFMYDHDEIRRFYGLGRISTIKQQLSGEILIGSEWDAYRCTKADLSLLEDPEFQDFPNAAFEAKARIDTVLAYPEVQDLLADMDGSVWISLVDGLQHLVQEERIKMVDKNRVFRANVQDMEQSADSCIWIGTNGSGLVVMRRDSVRIINAKKDLPGESINDIFIDGDSAIWIATNNGLGKISGYSFEKDLFPITSWYTQKDGILGTIISQVYRFKGKIYAISPAGLSILNESELAQINIPPPVYIVEVRINDDARKRNPDVHLNYRENNIHFSFTGLTYRNLGRVRFRYRLEGAQEASEGWTETFQTDLIYPGLSPGQYRFEVLAINQEGVSSLEPAYYDFIIDPPFYQRTWFLALLGLFVMMLVFMLFRYIVINQQRDQLQQLVDEKTAVLNANLNELTRANRELEQFAYAASHDLKTPLRTVIGHLQLLEKRYKGRLDEDADEFIAFAVGGAKKMNGMINDLLNYARVGRQRIDFVPVDLNETLLSVRHMLSILIDEPDVELEIADLPTILGIPTQWELLFQNLIENGLKFNHANPKVIRITAEEAPDYWRIYVADNGIGIAEEFQAKIFELFQRLHTTEFPGTGIGLAMCKKIVELHGGSIFIESELGKGTTFCITIAKDV